jgi:hypothetical protein
MDTADNALKVRYLTAFRHLVAESEMDDIAALHPISQL